MDAALVPYDCSESEEEDVVVGRKRGGSGGDSPSPKRSCLSKDSTAESFEGLVDLDYRDSGLHEEHEALFDLDYRDSSSQGESEALFYSADPLADELMRFEPEHVVEVGDDELLDQDLVGSESDDGSSDKDEECEEVGIDDEGVMVPGDGLRVRRRGKPSVIESLCTRVTTKNGEARHVAGELSVDEELLTDTWIGFESLRCATMIQCDKDIDKLEILARTFDCFRGPVSFSAMVLVSKLLPRSKLKVYCEESGQKERISACAATYLGRCPLGTQ
jgi:hypothetical protein